ncbi:MAG: VacJ family lipoprotein [Gammaproteobacteria bacterium]|nr:VacJ family lipoprotein [Gammaproteobacteria bacterium]MBP6053738.1 VacJ family lipoprotein [Pseudomonadales bacterium]MBK6581785.1 VacJ family lipoprotein [Gammaproteobacteria bacterium]MBK7169506.1 VacJ family lipoprotein [Gammaproteobacteria bacterium]MBK7520622.1 VacJ family lipoprotein [Gammaproteobacteria bacterium]
MRLRFAWAGTVTALMFGLLLGSAAAWCEVGEPDPLEGFNRGVFEFNDVLDRNLLKPVAKGYQTVTPQFVDTGVSNVFTNLGKVPAFINHVLQWRLAEAGSDGRRFVVNSTLGLFGLFDVASKLGIEQYDTDLGVTLGRWGVGPGAYIVLPLLGPSTVRDGVSRGGDLFLHPLFYVDDDTTKWSLRALEMVDLRADLLSVEELITGDRYVFLRNLYLQRREFLITGELPEDDFGDEDF